MVAESDGVAIVEVVSAGDVGKSVKSAVEEHIGALAMLLNEIRLVRHHDHRPIAPLLEQFAPALLAESDEQVHAVEHRVRAVAGRVDLRDVLQFDHQPCTLALISRIMARPSAVSRRSADAKYAGLEYVGTKLPKKPSRISSVPCT